MWHWAAGDHFDPVSLKGMELDHEYDLERLTYAWLTIRWALPASEREHGPWDAGIDKNKLFMYLYGLNDHAELGCAWLVPRCAGRPGDCHYGNPVHPRSWPPLEPSFAA